MKLHHFLEAINVDAYDIITHKLKGTLSRARGVYSVALGLRILCSAPNP